MTVLDVLEQHANENINEIAKKCSFSHQKVRRIIKHLEEKNIIWGYSPITDKNGKDIKHFTLLTTRSNDLLNLFFLERNSHLKNWIITFPV